MQSDAVFPDLIGRDWNLRTRPMWATSVQQSKAMREVRIAYAAAPMYLCKIGWEFLRAGAANGSTTRTDLDALADFYFARQGRKQSFLFRHWYDNTLTDELLGVGDGTRTSFPIVRNRGGLAEPVWWIDSTSLISTNWPMWTWDGAVMWYSDVAPMWHDTVGSGGFTIANGNIVFATAPAVDQPVRITARFLHRARFEADEIDLDNFLSGFWKSSLELRTTLGNKLL